MVPRFFSACGGNTFWQMFLMAYCRYFLLLLYCLQGILAIYWASEVSSGTEANLAVDLIGFLWYLKEGSGPWETSRRRHQCLVYFMLLKHHLPGTLEEILKYLHVKNKNGVWWIEHRSTVKIQWVWGNKLFPGIAKGISSIVGLWQSINSSLIWEAEEKPWTRTKATADNNGPTQRPKRLKTKR